MSRSRSGSHSMASTSHSVPPVRCVHSTVAPPGGARGATSRPSLCDDRRTLASLFPPSDAARGRGRARARGRPGRTSAAPVRPRGPARGREKGSPFGLFAGCLALPLPACWSSVVGGEEALMALLDKLRGELIDIIEWVDDSQHTLVFRFPRYQNEIKNGAQLIVRPGQCAIFVDQGQIADVFEPGRYELSTDNLPLLSTLRGWKHGFQSPFKCEVYFVSTRQITDLKWGTPNPIMLRDADFGPIRLRAFGTYSLRAVDPKILLRELVGTKGVFDANELGELMRSTIVEAF